MLGPNSRHWDSQGAREEEEDDDYENSAPLYKDLPPKPGAREEEEDDDYENSAPLYRDLPPKPGTKMEMPPEPWGPAKGSDLKLGPVTWASPRPGEQREDPSMVVVPMTPPSPACTSLCPGAGLDRPPALPPRPLPPVPWLGPKSKTEGSLWVRRLVVLLPLLLLFSVVLGAAALLVALVQYQELEKELRDLALQQAAWQANMTRPGGLTYLREDIDRLRASTNQSLMELRGLLESLSCPEDWLPFQGECYYFSQNTKSWDTAQKFCKDHFSHLVIVNSHSEQKFITRTKNYPSRVYWLGMSDRQKERVWRWLDSSLVTDALNFWAPGEPNDSDSNEDCGSLGSMGRWNDLPCDTTNYWICERPCPCG
ncbi:C-type lectin domain family 17, member A isoform X1 [Sorex araneus]|uniref:C-type lectin domain family 17, member A isoform X1 n=1 Tax=Sorex araneus TaxID=42254 RepID=UPI0024336F02|nr:C-type lectin domain family 17, member A isoform X1 [Sorex araneus]